jgi:HNH endonuclease
MTLNPETLKLMKILAERLWSQVDKSPGYGPKGDCWRWTGDKAGKGYGRFQVNGKTYRVHQLSFEIANGYRTPGLLVMHSCDTPDCVNPAHLSEGTNADNLRDARLKNRIAIGERHGKTHLTADDIREIRRRYENGEYQKDIARDYGLGQTGVGFIVRRETWKHI